jgi:hypothetical protein
MNDGNTVIPFRQPAKPQTTEGAKTPTKPVMAIKMNMTLGEYAEDGWFVMDNRKLIDPAIFKHAEVVIDLSDHHILVGPDSIEELSDYHSYIHYNDFVQAMIQKPIWHDSQWRNFLIENQPAVRCS